MPLYIVLIWESPRLHEVTDYWICCWRTKWLSSGSEREVVPVTLWLQHNCVQVTRPSLKPLGCNYRLIFSSSEATMGTPQTSRCSSSTFTLPNVSERNTIQTTHSSNVLRDLIFQEVRSTESWYLLSRSRNTAFFIENEVPSLFSQKPAFGTYFNPHETCSYPDTLLCYDSF